MSSYVGGNSFLGKDHSDSEQDNYHSPMFASAYEGLKMAKAYDAESVTGDLDHDAKTEEVVIVKEPSEKVAWADFDDRLIWLFSFFLIVTAAAYFYWATVRCEVDANDQTNLVMQYAIDEKTCPQRDE